MDTMIVGRLYVFAALRGDYDLVFRAGPAVRARRFNSGSAAYRFLTEELALDCATAANTLRMAAQPPLRLQLQPEQMQRLWPASPGARRGAEACNLHSVESPTVSTRPSMCMETRLEAHAAAR